VRWLVVRHRLSIWASLPRTGTTGTLGRPSYAASQQQNQRRKKHHRGTEGQAEINRNTAPAPLGEQGGPQIAFFSKTGHLLFRNSWLETAGAPLSLSVPWRQHSSACTQVGEIRSQR
jgi:hypothetical protein